ncbi:MAG: TIGR03943 family protein [Chloroflexales bacterium]|nr:TIGR03943 family protein [Chloroflexales bacterium]
MTTQAPSQEARSLNYVALLEVILLGGTAALLLSKWLRGLLDYYIHPRYTMLIVVAAFVLLLMAAVRLRNVLSTNASRRPGGMYLLLALPLLLGVLVPAQPLGADTLSGRGVDATAGASLANRQFQMDGDSTRWNLLEWSTALSIGDIDLLDKPVDVIGFVYHDKQLDADSFYVVRYVITCCSADGAGAGLPVVWENGGALPVDSWVRVQGKIGTMQIVGAEQAAIVASTVEPVTQPDNPYLYP